MTLGRSTWTAWAALLCLVFTPSQAAGQSPDGIRLGFEPAALRADAYATRLNPANLSLLDGFHTAVAFTDNGASLGSGRGVGWFNGFGTNGGFGAGVSGEWLRDAPRTAVASLGLSAGSRRLSGGLAIRGFFSDDRPTDRFHTLDLGLVARASQNVGFAVVGRNIGRSYLGDARVARSWRLALAARSHRGEVEAELSYDAVESAFGDGTLALIWLQRLVPGLRLFGQLEASIAQDFELSRASAGLEFAVGPVITSVGASAGLGGDTGLGMMGSVELSVPALPQVVGAADQLLRIDLAGSFDEAPNFWLFAGGRRAFTDVLLQLDHVARDRHLAGVYLNLGGLSMGTGQLWELRQMLRRVQAGGGVVVVYLERATIRDLWLAAEADYVVAAPTVSVLGTGLSTTRTYLGGLLARLGVEAQFVRIGDYKSGPERFTRSEPSQASDEQFQAFLDSVWTTFRAGFEPALGDTAEVEAVFAQSPLLPERLLSLGLVDEIAHRERLPDLLDARFGRPLGVTRSVDGIAERDRYWVPPNEIAILHIDGSIVSGQSGIGLLMGRVSGATSVVRACAEIVATPSIRGVILRIDSPGGSAVASDVMRHAIATLAEARPLIISMGNIAASGGYYVAAVDAPIYAAPTTLTGSIGIYAGTFALEGLLDRVGVARLHDRRGGPSDFFNGRRWSDDETDAVYASIEASYELFLEHVATARDRTRDEVDAVAQGRIWSGADAVGAGLVDDTGGFPAAYDALREDLGLSSRADVTFRHFPSPQFSIGLAATRIGLTASPADLLSSRIGQVLDVLGVREGASLLGALAAAGPGTPMAMLDWWPGQ